MGNVVIDTGANIGIFSLLSSRRVGEEKKVFWIESQLNNFNYWEVNIEINGLENVRAIHIVLYSEDDKALSFECIGVLGHLSFKVTENLVDTVSLKRIFS